MIDQKNYYFTFMRRYFSLMLFQRRLGTSLLYASLGCFFLLLNEWQTDIGLWRFVVLLEPVPNQQRRALRHPPESYTYLQGLDTPTPPPYHLEEEDVPSGVVVVGKSATIQVSPSSPAVHVGGQVSRGNAAERETAKTAFATNGSRIRQSIRLAFLGDSVTRYQYLNLVHFLSTGSWNTSYPF